ncbi:MAG: hypothetical protein HC842_00245 [Cytophagales bacterium]|nr:hypothetical protein [Cytophagales bacterium]
MGELKAEVSSLADTAEIGTAAWWDRVVREFQVFDSPVVVGSKTTYAVLDPTKQIVKRVAVKQDASGTVVIKVAKEVGGSLEPLDDATGNDEIGSLESYLISRQPFGVDFLLVNLAADKLRVYATVYYHPVLDIDSVKEAVDQAIKGYIAALSFDGKVYVRRLTDAIQLAAGVRDVSPVVISGSSGSLSVSTDQVYETASGHVVEDPDVLFLSTLQFEPFEP